MYSRTVSLALIAAVVACPLWCGSGCCNAGQCCPQGESSQSDACCVSQTRDCCSNADQHGERGSEQQAPCQSQTSCQGGCGGAVIEKSVEVDGFSDVFFMPQLDAHAPVATPQLQCGHDRHQQHCCGSDGNHGRGLRTLHMSFLC